MENKRRKVTGRVFHIVIGQGYIFNSLVWKVTLSEEGKGRAIQIFV
jgi:hypothetical protein